MTKSEERALEAYPITMVRRRYDGIARSDDPYDSNLHDRYCFQRGYEQAEKDLALTWEDIKEIQRLLDVVWSEQEITAPIDEDSSIYPEVLKRFKKENLL